jgi:tetratricopeptide (TPR) repeat protein
VLVFTQGYTSPAVESTYLRAHELSTRMGDEASRLWITIGMWTVRIVRGEVGEAASMARRLLDATPANDAMALARGELLLAWSNFYMGSFAEGLSQAERALAHTSARDSDLLDHLGVDSRTSGYAVASLCHWHLGNLEASRQCSERALQLARETRHAYTLAITLAFAGSEASAFRRDFDSLRQHAGELLQVCDVHGFPNWIPQAVVWLAWSGAMRGAPETAAPPGTDPLAMLGAIKAMGANLALSYLATTVAEALVTRGHTDEADRLADEALGLVESTGDRMWAAETHRIKARVIDRRAGEGLSPAARNEAVAHLERAMAIARQQGSRSLELRAAVDLAHLLRAAGRAADARQLVASRAAGFAADEAAADLVAARAFLASGQP